MEEFRRGWKKGFGGEHENNGEQTGRGTTYIFRRSIPFHSKCQRAFRGIPFTS
jgi:hypothetical protein